IDRKDGYFPHTIDTLFLPGIFGGRGGSCASMPLIYLAVGRRLGYPLKLVAAHDHWFIRWDDPATGERVNMECSNKNGGFESQSDEYYLAWPHKMTRRQAENCGYLQSMTPREELATFLRHRSDCWVHARTFGPALQARAHACTLVPQSPVYRDQIRFG